MSKQDSKIIKSLSERARVNIFELSLYNMISKAKSTEQLDDEAWTIPEN